jgi:hypothetical protein
MNCSVTSPSGSSATAERRVVVDEVLGEVGVHGAEIPLGEQRVDEVLHDRLVALCRSHGSMLRRFAVASYPGWLGFFPVKYLCDRGILIE